MLVAVFMWDEVAAMCWCIIVIITRHNPACPIRFSLEFLQLIRFTRFSGFFGMNGGTAGSSSLTLRNGTRHGCRLFGVLL